MKRFKQAVAFVVFLLSIATMDSQLYITAGVLAILSSIYLLTSSRKEQRDFIWELVRSMLKGEDHEKKNSIGVTGSGDAVTGTPVQLAS
ncbi:MAG: hypothetical protein DBY33_03920 [Lachnospiraceae bacterium]|nr:MAG: hypothetical protein DBY33_03920 [Lachnospiraceae bacterium]